MAARPGRATPRPSVTVALCLAAILLPGTPCDRGGHATTGGLLSVERGGHALIIPPLEPTGPLWIWLCIHRKEAAWNDTGDPYWGGLQMDRGFMSHYGQDMIRKYHGWADRWSPRDQMVVAYRAVTGSLDQQPRGYGPWPNTRKGCA